MASAVGLLVGGIVLLFAATPGAAAGARSGGGGSLGRPERPEVAGCPSRHRTTRWPGWPGSSTGCWTGSATTSGNANSCCRRSPTSSGRPLAVARGHLELLRDARGPTTATRRPTPRRVVAAGARPARPHRRRPDRDQRRRRAGADTAREPVFAPDVLDALGDRLEGLDLADVEIRPTPPVVLLGDEDRLTQALLNLVVNARTHTPAGTPGERRRDGDRRAAHAFRSATRGPGIDPELLPRCSNRS